MNKLYKLLRMKDDSVLQDLDKRMSAITGKSNVIQKLEEENTWRIEKTLRRFDIETKNPKSREVYEALLNHLKKSEEQLSIFLRRENGEEFSNFLELLKRGHELMSPERSSSPSADATSYGMKPKKLWVLKKEKFREILETNPPPNILKKFGYKTGKELFEKEKLEEIASSLRFMETSDWMHKTFDKAYLSLTPADFEEREVEAILLSGKWLEAGREFVKKKHHNLSHLKELGLIFIIPIKIDNPGELMRVFTLYLHYLYEVQFYSDLFRNIRDEGEFSKKLISLLRGDVLESAPDSRPDISGRGSPRRGGAATKSSFNWLIVQRYLAKEDEWEKRLFVPHVNPEAIHWRKAEEALARVGEKDLALTLEAWVDLDWVGGYFSAPILNRGEARPDLESGRPDGAGDELISFDLIDTVMSLVDKKYTAKYLYHQQEALWNRLFGGYMGDGDKLERLVKENLLQGYINVRS